MACRRRLLLTPAAELPGVRIVAGPVGTKLPRRPGHLRAEPAKLGGNCLIVQLAVLAERLPRLCHRLDERNAQCSQRSGDEVHRVDGLQALNPAEQSNATVVFGHDSEQLRSLRRAPEGYYA